MAAKKRNSAERALKSEIKTLKAKLKRAEVRVDRWKDKARRAEKVHAESQTRVSKLTKRLDKAAARSTLPSVDRPPLNMSVPTSATPAAAPNADELTPPTPSPDASWTVVRLREEARTRGLTGISGKTKAQLIALLT